MESSKLYVLNQSRKTLKNVISIIDRMIDEDISLEEACKDMDVSSRLCDAVITRSCDHDAVKGLYYAPAQIAYRELLCTKTRTAVPFTAEENLNVFFSLLDEDFAKTARLYYLKCNRNYLKTAKTLGSTMQVVRERIDTIRDLAKNAYYVNVLRYGNDYIEMQKKADHLIAEEMESEIERLQKSVDAKAECIKPKYYVNAVGKAVPIPSDELRAKCESYKGISIAELVPTELSPHSRTVLHRCGINWVEDFMYVDLKTISRTSSCGEKTFNEILSFLAKREIDLPYDVTKL